MIEFAREVLYEVIGEVEPLLKRHYLELAKNQDRVQLDPDWPRYVELERAGSLVIFTVRQDKALKGYAAFFVAQHMHYRGLTLANNDVLFLADELRGGTTGVRFIKFCEDQLRSVGQQVCVAWHAKPGTTLDGILPRLDYSIQDVIHSKLL